MSEEQKFWVADVRQAKICMSGARDYFKARDWDWNDFLRNGRALSDLVEQGDLYAERIVTNIRERETDGR